MTTVAERMQESVKAYAKHVYKNPKVGRNLWRREAGKTLNSADLDSDLREMGTIEDLMRKYGGDPMELIWNKEGDME